MKDEVLTVDREFCVEFYDVDPMQVAWHGNYVKFFELGRCAMLDRLGYGYREMEKSGYAWPVVDLRVKYIRPLVLHQKAIVRTSLLEYENRLRLGYRIIDPETGAVFTKGESTQMAVDMATLSSCFVSPACLLERVESCAELVGLAAGDGRQEDD